MCRMARLSLGKFWWGGGEGGLGWGARAPLHPPGSATDNYNNSYHSQIIMMAVKPIRTAHLIVLANKTSVSGLSYDCLKFDIPSIRCQNSFWNLPRWELLLWFVPIKARTLLSPPLQDSSPLASLLLSRPCSLLPSAPVRCDYTRSLLPSRGKG